MFLTAVCSKQHSKWGELHGDRDSRITADTLVTLREWDGLHSNTMGTGISLAVTLLVRGTIMQQTAVLKH